MAKLLLEKSASVDSTDNSGKTALHWAAERNLVAVAEILIAHSADLNATPVSGLWNGLTPLKVAEKKGSQEMVKLLKNAATACRYHKDCETTQACSGGQWAPPMTSGKCVDLCFCENCNKGVNNARDRADDTPLHQAAKKNNAFAAKLLLENSANVDSADYDGRTALHWAAKKNSVDVAKLLLEKSANVDST